MRTFAQMIARIKTTDAELMAAIVEAAGYTLHQYHANNRKVDGSGTNLAAQLIEACPVWLRPSMQGWLQQGKRDASRDMDHWQDVAAAKITGFFREQQQKREEARVKRAAKKAAPKAHKAAEASAAPESDEVVETIECEAALVLPNGTIELSAEEAEALAMYLVEMRTKKPLRLAA